MKQSLVLIAMLSISTQLVEAKDFNILDYGAARNQLSTLAVQKAIDACHSDGGGKVVVPTGVFVIGAIILKSNIDLYLEQGAELRSSENLEDFKIGTERYGMFFCQDASNISITGRGIINGMGSTFYDPSQNHQDGLSQNTSKPYDLKYTRQKENYLPKGTFFTDGPIKRKPRPGMTIVFFHCNRVMIKDVTIKDTPIWAIRFGYCEDVVVDGISLSNNIMIPNNDGIHITVSRNIKISNCDIIAGDDAIIITGFAKIENTPDFDSKEQDIYTHGNKSIYSENIQVTNCRLRSRSSAIRIGYGQHPIRKCVFSNIIITESNRGIGIFAHDASDIEELIFTDIIMETRLHNGIWWGNGEPIHLSSTSRFAGKRQGKIKNIQFNNISATAGHGILIYGDKESNMENIQFNNLKLDIVKGRETMTKGGNFELRPTATYEKQIFEHDIPGIYAQYVNSLSIRNFNLKWGDGLPAFFSHGIECLEVHNLIIDDFVGEANPNSPTGKRLVLEKSALKK
ncbi:MAG: glycosyl hydrolase family 28 protein [Chryseolinea sp.]